MWEDMTRFAPPGKGTLWLVVGTLKDSLNERLARENKRNRMGEKSVDLFNLLR